MHLQAITLTGIEWTRSQDSHSSSIRLYHIVALIGLVFLSPRIFALLRQISKLQLATLAMLIIFFLYSSAISRFELTTGSLLPGIAIVFALLGMVFGISLGTEKTIRLFALSVGGAFALLVLKTAAYFAVVGGLPRNDGGRPNILFLYAGGNNIEVSWLGAFTCFLPKNYILPALAIVVMHSVLYQSRSGLMVAGLVFLLRSGDFVPKNRRSLFAWGVGGLVVFIAGLSGVAFAWESSIKPAVEKIQDRFSQIGDENEFGSSTRLEIWEAAYEGLKQRPWGNGIGRTMPQIRETADRDFHENNVHNIYLQFAADLGVHSLAIYLMWAFAVVFFLLSQGADYRLLAFLLSYWSLAMLQFTGYETFFWLMAGVGTCVPRHSIGDD